MTNWNIYLVRCRNNTLYTGIATDVARRFQQHASGKGGARYLRGRGPLELVFQQPVGNRSTASRIEHRVRKLPRKIKNDLPSLTALIDRMLCEFDESVSEDDHPLAEG